MGLVGAADPRHRWFLAAAQRRRAGVRVVDVSEPDAALRQELTLQYDLPGRPDHRALLELSAPSLVAVAQRSGSGPAVIDALDHGVDVVVAPPVCDTLSELETIAGLVTRSGRRVTAAHTYRGHPASRVAKELLDDGRLGRGDLVALLSAGDDDGFRRSMVDGLDLFLWLTGATSGQVSAVSNDHPARADDPAEFSDAYGALVVMVTASSPTWPGELILEVRRRPGAAEGRELFQLAGSTGAVEWDVDSGLLRSAVNGADPRTVGCGRLDQPADWVLDNLVRRSRPAVSTAESLAATRILLLAEESLRQDDGPRAWHL